MDETPTEIADKWEIISARITLFQTRLYHNGLQQIRVQLWLEPLLDKVPVRLSARERQGIRLIDYDRSESELPFNDDGSIGDYQGWSAQRNYRGYTFYPDASATMDKGTAADQSPGESLDFYVSANDRALGRNPLRLAFAIYGDNGSTWRTTGEVRFSDNTSTYYSYLDLREDIAVEAMTPVRYSADNFQLDRRPLVGVQPIPTDDAAIFDDIVTISIVAAVGRNVGVRDMECTPAGMIHWISDTAETYNPCFTGYARPGQTQIHWNRDVPTGNMPRPTLHAPEESKGVILLCGRNDIRRGDYTNPPRGPIAVHLTDEYGTIQARQLAFVRGERDTLEIR